MNQSMTAFGHGKNNLGEGISQARFRNRASDVNNNRVRNNEIENALKFDHLVEGNKVLYKISSVFPFAFFPDMLIIDPIKVNMVFREFFASERIHGIYIKNITDIFVDTGPFFATLKIVDQGYVENTESIKYLKKKEALKAREIIQGLIVAIRSDIDTSAIDDQNLVEKLVSLGEA